MINMASYPISAPCPGCIDGTCPSNNGMVMAYPPYYGGMHDEMVLQCMPLGPAPGPEFLAYGYGAPMFFHQPAHQFQHGYQSYHQPNRGNWQNKGRRGSFKNRYNKNSSHAQPPPDIPISSALESAIMTIRTNPQANLFSIDGEL